MRSRDAETGSILPNRFPLTPFALAGSCAAEHDPLRRLCLPFLRHLRADSLHPLTRLSDALAAVRRRVDQLLEARRELRSEHLANLTEQRLYLRKNANVFRVAVTEKVQVDGAVVDKRSGHVPVGDHHAQIAVLLAEQRRLEIAEGLRIELAEIPIARF